MEGYESLHMNSEINGPPQKRTKTMTANDNESRDMGECRPIQ